jgi:hypothetical protein
MALLFVQTDELVAGLEEVPAESTSRGWWNQLLTVRPLSTIHIYKQCFRCLFYPWIWDPG